MPTANQILQVQFIPTTISEVVPSTNGRKTGMNLVLHPGEPNSVIIQLQNTGSRSLDITLQLEGDCPSSWYQIGLEGHHLSPGHRMDAIIQFQIPAHYFEDQNALNPNQSLTLNFTAQVIVTYREAETESPLLEVTTLNLLVYPRCRYLQYLPTIYREVDFIGRFLKIFEQGFDPIVQTLGAMWAYLDPLTAPEAFQLFLAHWVGWEVDPRWSPAQQRRLIRNAMEIYRWRGTRHGLRLFLHLYTNLPLDDHLSDEREKHICIEDATYKAFSLSQARLGQDTALGRGQPYHFIVRLRLTSDTRIDEDLVHAIITQEKPAFSTYELFIEDLSAHPTDIQTEMVSPR